MQIKTNYLLHIGWVVPIIYIIGSLILGALLPGYNSVAQTLSEIGEEGSNFKTPWMIFEIILNGLMIIFAVALLNFSKQNRLSIIPVLFLVGFGIAGVGTGIFPTPHSLHNTFGSTNLIWSCAPLIFAISWKRKNLKQFRIISFIVFLLVIVATILNLNPMFDPPLYSMEYYGLAQRFIIYGFFLYCAYVSYAAIKYSEKLS